MPAAQAEPTQRGAVPTPRGTPPGAWSLRSCLGLAALLAAILIFANRGLFSAEIYEIWDPAANSILVQDAKRLQLLTGNYSRVGFNHPGPAILYVLAAGEGVFHDLLGVVRSPIAGQLLAVLAYNSLWIGLLLWVLARSFGSMWLGVGATSLFVAITLVQDGEPLVSLWFPHLYYFPFAVFTAAVARLAAGRLDALWLLVLTGGVLVHGHVSFVAIAGLMALGAIVAHLRVAKAEGRAGWRSVVRHAAVEERKQLVVAAAIATVFALPILLNTILNFPGEVPKYFGYGSRSTRHGWRETTAFVGYFWAGRGVLPLLTGLLLLGCLWRAQPAAPIGFRPADMRGIALAVALATAALAFYATVGIDLLEMKYTGYFYFAAVALALAAAAVHVLGHLPPAGALLALVSVPIAAALAPASGVMQNREIPQVSEALRRLGNPPIVLDLDSGTDWQRLWSEVVGVAAYDTRRGERNLCIRRNWHVLFTARYRCTDDDVRRGTPILVSARKFQRTPGDGTVEMAGLSFVPAGMPPRLGPEPFLLTSDNAAQAARVLGEGWSSPEKDFTWSVGHSSMLTFSMFGTGPARLALDLAAFLPRADSVQEAEVLTDGRKLATLRFSRAEDQAERVVEVPPEAIGPGGRVSLEIRVKAPASPASAGLSADPRLLGVRIRSIRLLPA